MLRSTSLTAPALALLLACSTSSTNGDPQEQTAAIDPSQYNVGSSANVDTNGDGVLDGVLVDSNGDGVGDVAVVDTNGDGLGDALVYPNGNGTFQSTPPISAAGTGGGGSSVVAPIAGAPSSGLGGGGSIIPMGTAGTIGAAGSAGASTAGASTAGASTGGSSGEGGASTVGGAGGEVGVGGSAGAIDPGAMPMIDPGRANREDIQFNVSDADPTASGFHGGGQLASFDGSATTQGKLVITTGGIGGGPHTGGAYQWAAGRGFHCLAVDMFNSEGGSGNGGLVYLESFSGQDLTPAANVTPQNGIMNRVKTALAYLATVDPGADWGFYLDGNGEVIWGRVILWGYSYGGQTVVAATKFVAAHRVVATSAPNIPTGEAAASWITDMPNLTDVNNCYAINDGEDGFEATLTTMGWIGPSVRIFDGGALLVDPPFNGSHMLDMSGGHTEFCSLPNAAYDAACDHAFGTIP